MKKITLFLFALLAVNYAVYANYAMGPAAVSISIDGGSPVLYALPIQNWDYNYYFTWADNQTGWSGYAVMDPLPPSTFSGDYSNPTELGTVTSLVWNSAVHVLWTDDPTVTEYVQYRVFPESELGATTDTDPPYINGVVLDGSTITMGTATTDQRREADANIDLVALTSGPGGYYLEMQMFYAEQGATAPEYYVPGSWVMVHFTVEATAIPEVKAANAIVAGGKSSISATFEGVADVSVYSVQGALIQKTIAQSTFETGNLPAGIYLVKINNKTYKTVVQ